MRYDFPIWIVLVMINIKTIKSDKSNHRELSSIISDNETSNEKSSNFRCREPIIDCSNNGICFSNNMDCDCFPGFTTIFIDLNKFYQQNPRCNYKRKSQFIALCLSLFISFGSLHFYLGNSVLGVFQLILFASIAIFNISMIVYLSIKHIGKYNTLVLIQTANSLIVVYFFNFIMFSWWILDIWLTILNIYVDSNGVGLDPIDRLSLKS